MPAAACYSTIMNHADVDCQWCAALCDTTTLRKCLACNDLPFTTSKAHTTVASKAGSSCQSTLFGLSCCLQIVRAMPNNHASC
jgi:hypothetical protein